MHLSYDIDALDPVVSPSTGTPGMRILMTMQSWRVRSGQHLHKECLFNTHDVM